MRKRAGFPIRPIVGACLVLGLGAVRPAYAAPIVVNVSASTCFACWSDPTLPSVTIDAQLVGESRQGAFWDPFYGETSHRVAFAVTGFSGTLNVDSAGPYELTFRGPDGTGDGWSAPLGDGSWLFDPQNPRYLVFGSDGFGFNTRIINDNGYNLFQWLSPNGFGRQVPIQWRVADPAGVPETASTRMLLAIGFAAFVVGRRKLTV